MDILVSQLSRKDLGGHFLPHQHASKTSQPQDSERVCNMFDKPCYLQYRCIMTTVKWVRVSIQIKRKRSETKFWWRWTKRLSLVPGNIWSEQTTTDSYTAEKNKTTQLEYRQCSEEKNKKNNSSNSNKNNKKEKKINNNNLNYSNNSDRLM